MTWQQPRLFCRTPGCLNSWDHQVAHERAVEYPGVMSSGSLRWDNVPDQVHHGMSEVYLG